MINFVLIMKAKIKILLFFIILSPYISFGQRYIDTSAIDDNVLKNEETKNYSLSMETGLIYSNYGKGLNNFSNYFFPSINYYITPRLNVNIGIIQLNQLYNSYLDETTNSCVINPATSYITSNGTYSLNNKISIYGEFLKKINDNSANQYSINPDLQNFVIGINYKINQNLKIGFEIHQSERNSPYYSPLYW